MDKDFQKDDILGRWLEGNLSETEVQELESRSDFEYYEQLIKVADTFSYPEFDTEKSYTSLLEKRNEVNNKQSKGRVFKLNSFAKKLAAASVVLLIGATVWFGINSSKNTFTTGFGDKEIATLTDGSEIRLNSKSEVTYKDTETARLLTLDGEAFFDVKKDNRTFEIETNLGSVTVLGTSFNVYNRNNEMKVACTTGLVRVAFKNNTEQVTLSPGESVVLTNNKVTKLTFDKEDVLDWLENKTIFNGNPLKEVIADLERQFDITVKYPENFNINRSIKTSYPHENVDTALDIVFGTLEGIDYKRNNKIVYLSQN